MNYNPTNIDRFAVSSLVCVIIFIYLPLAIYSRNLVDFGSVSSENFLIFSGIFTLIFSCITLMISKAIKSSHMLIVYGLYYLVAAGVFLPITTGAIQIELASVQFDKTRLAIALIIALICTGFHYTRLRSAIFSGAVAIVSVSIGTNILPILEYHPRDHTNTLRSLSSEHNLLVLSFDGVTRDLMIEVIEEDEELKIGFKDFTLFEHAVSPAPATISSVVAELSGLENLKEKFGNDETMLEKLDKSKLTMNQLRNYDYEVSSYGYYSEMNDKPDTAVPPLGGSASNSTYAQFVQFIKLTELGALRVLPAHVAQFIQPSKLAAAPLMPHPLSVDGIGKLFRSHKGPFWDRDAVLNIKDFNEYLDNLSVGKNENVAHFVHFLHTHFPVDFDENCEYRSHDQDWFDKNQNRDALKKQTHCAARQYVQFLDRLKELGVYNKSMIILKSDHGEPVNYFDFSMMESFKIREHPRWGFSRYTPFLAIKDSGTNQVTIDTSSRVALLGDLALTVCKNTVMASSGCDQYTGINLLDEVAGEEPDYWVYIVEDNKSNWILDTHEAVRLNRKRPFRETLNDYLTSELISELFECNKIVTLDNEISYNNGHTDEKSWVYWRDKPAEFFKIGDVDCNIGQIQLHSEDISLSSSNLQLAFRADFEDEWQTVDFEMKRESRNTILEPLGRIEGEILLRIVGGNTDEMSIQKIMFVGPSE